MTIEHLIAVAERSKMSVLDERMDAALREYSPVQLHRVCLQHARCLRSLRMEVEAGPLLQRLLLTAQAAGLGGSIHAALRFSSEPGPRASRPWPRSRRGAPKRTLLRPLRIPSALLPAWRANPVGLDDVLEGFCPPDYKNMSEAADALLEEKCGKGDTYGDPADFETAHETLDIAQRFLNEVPCYRTPAWPPARPPVFNLKGNY